MQPRTFRWAALGIAFAALACAAEPTQFQMVPMRDGVRLATDVHLPGAEGAWPVVVVRTPYGRNVGAAVDEALKLGYAVAVQDLRGMGQSEGERFVFVSDGWHKGLSDGADTLAWVKAQPWCDGRIGTFGPSALGIVQLLAAPVSGDIQAQVIQVATGNLYRDMFYQGGVFRKELLEGWLPATGQAERLAFYKSRPRFDDFWRDFDADARAAEVTAPALFVGGWQDIFCQGTIDAFAAREKSGGPGAKGHNYLIMTWGTHGPDISKDYKFAENRFDVKIEQAAFTFFAAHLQGKAEALKALPKVQYYVMGADTEGAPGNEWRSADAWPPFTAEPVPYYLHADGTLSPEKPRETGASLAFDFDPADPVPTLGGANLNIPAGPFDQRPLAERQDILRFTTAPLDAPLEITGRVVCRLFVSSDAPDTDFTAKLVDVYPAGDEREILLLDGIRRVKTRLGYDRTAPLLTGPEEIVEVEIDLQSIGFVFDKGHRIGLHVSSSNHPRFEVNPNTGADFPGEGEPPRIARNVVYAEAAHAGALYLPVRPGRAAPGRDSSLRTE